MTCVKHTPDDYRACANMGMTRRQAAEFLGVTLSTLKNMQAKHDIAFMPERRRLPNGDDMRALVKLGGYSPEEAERIISRPKVKISAMPPRPKPQVVAEPTRPRSLVPHTPRTGAGIRRPRAW